MEIIKEIEKILENHECQCYKIEEEKQKLTFIGQENSCCSLNPAVADVTGFLLANNIDYDMDNENNITLHLIPNIKLDSSLVNIQNMKL